MTDDELMRILRVLVRCANTNTLTDKQVASIVSAMMRTFKAVSAEIGADIHAASQDDDE